MDLAEFRNLGWDVSRETYDDLATYVDLLRKWTVRINLVARSTLPDLWRRHVLDSLQLLKHVGRPIRLWADFGSGGGLPGLVVAIAGRESFPGARFALVESDRRKAAFLQTVVQRLDLPADVIVDRVGEIEPLGADVISARALASLDELLDQVERHGSDDCVALFPKGANFQSEIAVALEGWSFRCEKMPSVTAADSVVLRIGEVRRA